MPRGPKKPGKFNHPAKPPVAPPSTQKPPLDPQLKKLIEAYNKAAMKGAQAKGDEYRELLMNLVQQAFPGQWEEVRKELSLSGNP